MNNSASNAAQERQVTIDGKSYTMKYSLKAYVALQDHFKLSSIDEVVARLNDPTKLGMMDIVALMWAGLRSHHRDVTMEDAFELADSVGINALQDIISAGIGASVPPSVSGGEQTVARP